MTCRLDNNLFPSFHFLCLYTTEAIQDVKKMQYELCLRFYTDNYISGSEKFNLKI